MRVSVGLKQQNINRALQTVASPYVAQRPLNTPSIARTMRAVVTALALLQTAAFQTPRLRRPPASTQLRRPPTKLRGAPIGPAEVEAAVDAAVKAALATAKSSTFWEVTTAFIAGGLFFSAAAAFAGAVYTYGEENVRYGLKLVRRMILRSWELFVAGLGAAKDEFLTPGAGRKRWRKAWNRIGSGVLDARKAARESVEAIKAEARLQAFALGAPGLQFLNHIVDRLTPLKLAAACEEAIKGACADFQHPSARKLELKSFRMGARPPQLKAARAYDVGKDAMAFDFDVKWQSELDASIEAYLKGPMGIQAGSVPVSLKNARVEGTVRLVLTPLGSEGPGFGASLLSFAKKPAIGLDLRVAGGEVTKVPWLKKELEGGVLQGLEDTMLWPKRVVAPADDERGRPLLSAEKLAELVNDDPLLRLERELEEKRSVLGVTDDENDDAKAFLIELNPPEVRREETKPPRWQRQLDGIKKGIAAKTQKKVAAKHDAAKAQHQKPTAVDVAEATVEELARRADKSVKKAQAEVHKAALGAFDLNGDGKVDAEDFKIAAERAKKALDEPPAAASLLPFAD